MRAPFQVLVIPFRCFNVEPEFAILKRRDDDYWQFVAGGGEEQETPVEAAQRETEEEIGISDTVFPLDSMTTIPKTVFLESASWDKDILVIPEHSFAVEIGHSKIKLSDEHTECLWGSYREVHDLIKWDSNRNALWELNQRLMFSNHGMQSILVPHATK